MRYVASANGMSHSNRIHHTYSKLLLAFVVGIYLLLEKCFVTFPYVMAHNVSMYSARAYCALCNFSTQTHKVRLTCVHNIHMNYIAMPRHFVPSASLFNNEFILAIADSS